MAKSFITESSAAKKLLGLDQDKQPAAPAATSAAAVPDQQLAEAVEQTLKDQAEIILRHAAEVAAMAEEIGPSYEYQLRKQSKSARMYITVRPWAKEALQRIADRDGVSLNELVCQVLEDYAQEREGQ